MENLLIATHDNASLGLRAQVWLTVNGKWAVTYSDTDACEQLGTVTLCPSREQADRKAREFVFGRAGLCALSI